MTIRSVSELKSIFVTGYRPTQQDFTDLFETYVASVNGRLPGQEGGVNTDYHLEPTQPPTKLWTDYKTGLTEFSANYMKSEYADYIAENPSFDQLEDGRIVIRTLVDLERDNALQQIDSVQNGMFDASHYRVGNADGTWGELVKIKMEPGPMGAQGEQGPQGDAGPIGPVGPQGPKGDTGATGAQGNAGTRGPEGPQGPAGPQGVKGDMGNGFAITKVYPSIVEMNADFSGTDVSVNDFVLINSLDEDNGSLFVKTDTAYVFQSRLTGVKGDRGEQGIQGTQGVEGPQGPQGLQGLQGVAGPRGEIGPQGPQGAKGDTAELPRREYLALSRRDTNANLVANQPIPFNFNVTPNSTIEHSLTNYTFKLKAGKVYRMSISMDINAGSAGYVTMGIFNADTNSRVNNEIWTVQRSTTSFTNAGHGLFDWIFDLTDATVDTNYQIRAVTAAVSPVMRFNYSRMIIQEV